MGTFKVGDRVKGVCYNLSVEGLIESIHPESHLPYGVRSHTGVLYVFGATELTFLDNSTDKIREALFAALTALAPPASEFDVSWARTKIQDALKLLK